MRGRASWGAAVTAPGTASVLDPVIDSPQVLVLWFTEATRSGAASERCCHWLDIPGEAQLLRSQALGTKELSRDLTQLGCQGWATEFFGKTSNFQETWKWGGGDTCVSTGCQAP